jgi:hypothetical protein
MGNQPVIYNKLIIFDKFVKKKQTEFLAINGDMENGPEVSHLSRK